MAECMDSHANTPISGRWHGNSVVGINMGTDFERICCVHAEALAVNSF